MLNIECGYITDLVDEIKSKRNQSSDHTAKVHHVDNDKKYDIVVTPHACHLPAPFVKFIGEGTLGIFGGMIYNAKGIYIIKQRNGDYTLLTQTAIIDYSNLDTRDFKELFTFKAEGPLDGTLMVTGVPLTHYTLDGTKVILEDPMVRRLLSDPLPLLNNVPFDNLRQRMYVRLHLDLAWLVLESTTQQSAVYHQPTTPFAEHRLQLFGRRFDISFARARARKHQYLFTTLDSVYKMALGAETQHFTAVITDDGSNIDSLDTVLDSAVFCELMCKKRATLDGKSSSTAYAIMFDGSRIGTYGVPDKKIVLEVVPENLFSTEDGFVNFIKASLGV